MMLLVVDGDDDDDDDLRLLTAGKPPIPPNLFQRQNRLRRWLKLTWSQKKKKKENLIFLSSCLCYQFSSISCRFFKPFFFSISMNLVYCATSSLAPAQPATTTIKISFQITRKKEKKKKDKTKLLTSGD